MLVLIAWGPPKFRARDPLDALSGDIDAWILIQLGFWLVAGLYLLLHLLRAANDPSDRSDGEIPVSIKLYGVFLILCLISSLYSSFPLFTAAKSLQLILMIWILVHFAQWEPDKGKILWYTVYTVAILNVASMVTMYFLGYGTLLYGEYQGRFRLHGGPISDYGYSGLALAGLGLTNFLFSHRRKFSVAWLTLFFLGSLLVALSWTRSTIAAMLLGTLYILWRGRHQKPFFAIPVILAVLSIPVVFRSFFFQAFQLWQRDVESIQTLSARTIVWENLLEGESIFSTLFGRGYLAFTRELMAWGLNILGDAHNSLLEAYSGAGLIGAAVLFATLIIAAYYLFFGRPRQETEDLTLYRLRTQLGFLFIYMLPLFFLSSSPVYPSQQAFLYATILLLAPIGRKARALQGKTTKAGEIIS